MAVKQGMRQGNNNIRTKANKQDTRAALVESPVVNVEDVTTVIVEDTPVTELETNVVEADVSVDPVAEAFTSAVVMEEAVVEGTKVDAVEVYAQVFNLVSPEAPVKEQKDDVVTLTPMRASVTTASCVRALEKAIGFGKQALYLEVAVSLATFASSSTGADRATKRAVMDVYTKAGYNTAVTGEDYKTVSRRINASAALYEKIGREAILSAMRGLREGKAIDSLCGYLDDTYQFTGINAVLEYAGKPVKQTNTPEHRAARLASAGGEDRATHTLMGERIAAKHAQMQTIEVDADGIVISAGALSIVVPRDCAVGDLRAMAAKLLDFADRTEAALGTPEEQRNQSMHS